ncbi:MAG: hypothetical protein JXL80_10980 [Planctomycetes bacterium]|nr:hypothetical protein [Planctomycetota bacterium]
MSGKTTRIAVAAALVVATASAAAAQRSVDLRINLSTQPVYSSYDRRPINMDYARASSLLGSGNIRGGKALMINRNFLEDRYFSGSLTRFYRDTVGVQDVNSGMSYGVAQPYFRPGSLTTNTSSLMTRQVRSADPFGVAAQPFGGASSPFSVTYSVPASTQPVLYRAQFPAQYNLGSIRSEISPESLEYSTTSLLSRQQMYQQALPRPTNSMIQAGLADEETPVDRWTRMRNAALNPDAEGLSLQPNAATPGERSWRDPTTQPTPEFQRFATPEPAYDDEDGSAGYTMKLRRTDESATGDFESAQPTEYLFPKEAAEILLSPERPRKLDEQYYQLGLLDLDAGAYEQAADAFKQSGTLNLQRSWDAGRYEGWSWLLCNQFHRAANILQRTLTEKPEQIDPAFRLTSVMDRAEDWQAAEKALQTVLAERPDSATHAFLLAYLRIFLGRPAEAQALLPVAEKNSEYAEAARLLREKTIP